MKITIILPVHNGAATLRRALDSTLDQGADHVVAIDDASTDDTPRILAGYPHVRVHRHAEKSTDHLRAMEPVIEQLETDYVIGLGADDWLYPGMVAEIRRTLAARPDLEPGVVFCDFDHVTADPEPRLIKTLRYSPVKCHLPPDRYKRHIASFTHRSECGVGSAIRHSLLLWLQREDWASLGPWSDVYGYILAGVRAGAVYIPGPYAAFTVRRDSFSGSNQSDPVRRRHYEDAARAFLARPAIRDYATGIQFPI